MELSLQFLSSPWKIYENGTHTMKQIVLRLAFSEPLIYYRKEVYGTIESAFPFKVLDGVSGQECKMAPPERLELPTH